MGEKKHTHTHKQTNIENAKNKINDKITILNYRESLNYNIKNINSPAKFCSY